MNAETTESATLIAVEVGRLAATMEERDKKLDAIHSSINRRLDRIEAQTTKTNGRVSTHDEKIAMLKGIAIAFGTASPFLVALMAWGLTRVLG